MQPILAPSGTTVAAAVAALTTTSTVRAGRARAQINYAEGASGDEFEDDSDDEDFSNSKREAAAKRARATGAGSLQAALAASSTELDQSYLGKQPPSKYISSKLAVPTKHKYDYLDVMEAAAAKRELLVPIKVEVDTDTHRIRDCFTWNLNEELITPQAFAQTFCADLDLPFHHVDTIVNMIRAQLDEHSGVVAMDVGGNDDDPTIEEPDCRVILRLDVQLDNYHLVDHIEWDLCSSPATPDTTPEAFAKQLCADLGLRGEAIPIVAHALHEEIIKHKKDAVEWGVLGGLGAVPEDGGYRRNQRGPRRLRGVWRDWLEYKDYGPTLEVLTPEELEKKEMERERASSTPPQGHHAVSTTTISTMDASELTPTTFKPLLEHLITDPKTFTESETRRAFHQLALDDFQGADPVQVGAFLMALNYSKKTHEPEVIAAAADVMREYAAKVLVEGVDERVERVVDILPFHFLPTSTYQPSITRLQNVRTSLPFRSIFNVLGPLLNPASPKGIVLGVYQAELGEAFAHALRVGGYVERALVVCGCEGLDEISVAGGTKVWSIEKDAEKGGLKVEFMMLHPVQFGLQAHPLEEVVGSTPEVNAAILEALLTGKTTVERDDVPPKLRMDAIKDFVLLNAAALLVVAGLAQDWKDGVRLARQSLESGKAWEAFCRYREWSLRTA
ncbi:Chromatin structure remodeling complex protein sfh1 [Tulasnella sp. 403]|nr:Chromatin structure remodeling complex protein sfh1 [Tulasnella sp. 403]